MSTTTIRIDDDLKARIAAVAEQAGKSAHAFIVDAVADAVQRVEQDEALHRLADERWAHLVQTGKSVPWADARAYLLARAEGERPRRPAARRPAR